MWADPARWPEWNSQLADGELEGSLAVGEKVRVKYRRGGKMQFEITALEPERLLADEARLPGARLGHEHRLTPTDGGCEISHRIYVRGPAASFWALMLGRRRIRESVTESVERQRGLVETR